MSVSSTPASSAATPFPPLHVDVLCAGFACHDLVFDVPRHPGPDEKARATALLNCGGGLASNAAVTAARLGCRTAFVGYVGADVYGDLHMAEFHADGVITDWVVRGAEPTPLSAIIIKPDGQRTIVNYRGHSEGACAGRFDLTQLHAKSILIDGHQFELAKELAQYARANRAPIVIDADALRPPLPSWCNWSITWWRRSILPRIIAVRAMPKPGWPSWPELRPMWW
ncbi:MAG: PfkB family carbohydrate kinase [Caldilineaceae bacterium]